MNKKIWREAEVYYIKNKDSSFKSVSEKFDIPFGSVKSYARSNSWFKKKRDFQYKVMTKTAEKLAGAESDKLVKLANVADAALETINEVFKNPQQFNRYVVSESDVTGALTVSEKIFDRIDTKSIRDAVATLKDLTSVIRNVNNLPTDAEKQAMNIAREKMELEKKKNEDENDVNTRIEVVFEKPGNENDENNGD